MPFAGFECDVTGEQLPAQACIQCAARGARAGCPMTAPVVWGIAANLRPDDFELSVTGLIGCPRKHGLMRQTEYYLRPSEAWWALRGTLMHQIIASYAAADLDAIAERRFRLEVDGVRLSGQPDLVLPARRHLVDFKTASRLPAAQRRYVCPETGLLIKSGYHRAKYLACSACLAGEHRAKDIEVRVEPEPKPHHVRQLSVYRLLLAANGLAIDTAEIVYLDMTGQLRLPVALAPLAETEAWVRARLAQFDLPLGRLPPVLTDPAETWECGYCPVQPTCAAR